MSRADEYREARSMFNHWLATWQISPDVNKHVKPIRRALRIAEAVEICKHDNFECPVCGHFETWWADSNADYMSREPELIKQAEEGEKQ